MSKILEVVGAEVENDVGAVGLSVINNLGEEIGRSLRRNGTRDDEAIHAGGLIENLVELLLVLGSNGSTGVKDTVLVLTVVHIRVDTRDTVSPDGLTEAAEVHDLFDDELAREAGEETECHGVGAHLLKGEGNVETLAVSGVASGAGTDVLVGNKRRARHRHVDGRICG